MNKNQLQQGDVTLQRVENIDLTNAKKIKRDNRGIILAEGEVTGHYHGIEDKQGVSFLEYEGKRYLQVEKTVSLKHQEHGNVDIEPGVWQVGGIKEYDYFSKMVRKVVD